MELVTSVSHDKMLGMMASIQIESANSKEAADKDRIMGYIAKSGMTCAQINNQLEAAIAQLMHT